MLVDVKNEKRSWISSFKKKFSRLCKNAPIALTFEVLNDRELIVTDYSSNHALSFMFSFEKGVSDFISEVKNEVKKWYPIITVRDTVETELNHEEIQKLILSGSTFEEAVSTRHIEITDQHYRIDKVFNNHNSLQLEDIQTGAMQRYYCKAPVAVLIPKLSKETTEREFFDSKFIPITKSTKE